MRMLCIGWLIVILILVTSSLALAEVPATRGIHTAFAQIFAQSAPANGIANAAERTGVVF